MGACVMQWEVFYRLTRAAVLDPWPWYLSWVSSPRFTWEKKKKLNYRFMGPRKELLSQNHQVWNEEICIFKSFQGNLEEEFGAMG